MNSTFMHTPRNAHANAGVLSTCKRRSLFPLQLANCARGSHGEAVRNGSSQTGNDELGPFIAIQQRFVAC